MPTTLPIQPSLRQLQIQAKELAKALKQLQPEALDRLHKCHPDSPKPDIAALSPKSFQLHDAQLVIAREYGFESWSKLREAIDRDNLRNLANAVQHGDVPRVRAILRQNPKLVNLDMSETDEHRVIHYAVLRRDGPMVRALMRTGADARKGIYPYRDATTAYVFAKERGFDDIAAMIEQEEQLRRKELSCPNATVSSAQDSLYSAIRKHEFELALEMLRVDPGLINACDREGGTPLHIACEEGALPVIDWLLDHRANPRKKNLQGWTALEAALIRVGWRERTRRESFPEVARRMLQRGALTSPLVAAALGDLEELRHFDQVDPKSLREVHLLHRGGPLSVTVTFSKPAALELLLELGLDANERHRMPDLEEEVYSEGQPLWLAAAFGEYEMAQMLLAHGANASAQVYASGTPVSRAYGAHDNRMKALLAEHGGRPEPSLIGAHRDIGAAAEILNENHDETGIEELLWGAACGGSPEIVAMCLEKLNWPPTDARWYRMLVARFP